MGWVDELCSTVRWWLVRLAVAAPIVLVGAVGLQWLDDMVMDGHGDSVRAHIDRVKVQVLVDLLAPWPHHPQGCGGHLEVEVDALAWTKEVWARHGIEAALDRLRLEHPEVPSFRGLGDPAGAAYASFGGVRVVGRRT